MSLIDRDDVEELNRFLKTKAQCPLAIGTEIDPIKILHQASTQGKLQIVKYLLEKKQVRPDIIFISSPLAGTYEGSLLTCSVRSGNLDLVKYLLETYKLDIEDRPPNGKRVWNTPLNLAVKAKNLAIVDYLLNQGAKVNPRLEGVSISSNAILTGDLNILNRMMEGGAEIEEWQFDKAIESKSLPMVEYFLEKFPGIENRFCSRIWDGSTACLIALSGNLPLLKHFMKRPDFVLFPIDNNKDRFRRKIDPKYELLIYGAKSRQVDMIRYLVEELSLIEYREQYAHDILSNLIKGKLFGPSFYNDDVIQNTLESLRYLIEEKHFLISEAQINSIIKNTRILNIRINAYLAALLMTPGSFEQEVLRDLALHDLTAMDLPRLLRLFSLNLLPKCIIELHSHISRFSIDDFSAQLGDHQFAIDLLFYSAHYLNNKNFSLLNYLLDSGMDPNQENRLGESLLNYVYRLSGYGSAAEFLIDHGADPYREDSSGFSFAKHLVIDRYKLKLENQLKDIGERKELRKPKALA